MCDGRLVELKLCERNEGGRLAASSLVGYEGKSNCNYNRRSFDCAVRKERELLRTG